MRRALALAIGAGVMTLAMLVAPASVLAGPAWRVVGGNAQHGPPLIVAYGCAACHTVPGVKGARGNVGPPLTRFGDRTYIAGMLRNTPANLVRWIRDPQGVLPGNAMPNMGVTEAEARDIAAYLYTLR
ncbi:MAG: c-type cytochrome [Pseudomonadota bacterium]|nr:c-type cytochrome [Pseudomonadota bacterium]